MKNKIIALAALSIILASCNSNSTRLEQRSEPRDTITSGTTSTTITPASGDFDITTIPVSEVKLGEFPFIDPPKGYCYDYCSSWTGKANPKHIKSADKEYFALNGKLIPVEGNAYKETIEKNMQTDTEKFSRVFVENSYDKAIKALGGVQVNNETIANSEVERIGKEELTSKGFGNSIDFNLLDHIKTYVIRTKDKTVWIQFFGLNDESGRITILETKN